MLDRQAKDRFEDDPWLGWLRTASPPTDSDSARVKHFKMLRAGDRRSRSRREAKNIKASREIREATWDSKGR